MKRKEDASTIKDISNNMLVLILIIIIFVSLLGTLIIKQAVEDIRTAKTGNVINTKPLETGKVAVTILPSKEGVKKT
jgi:hypothetical protein